MTRTPKSLRHRSTRCFTASGEPLFGFLLLLMAANLRKSFLPVQMMPGISFNHTFVRTRTHRAAHMKHRQAPPRDPKWSDDDMLTPSEAGVQYGYGLTTFAAYIRMGYVVGINGKIPRYELERYIVERKSQGRPDKVDWEEVRKKIIKVAVALSGGRPGWHYNKGAYVLAAARILGHSPIWIAKVLKVPLNEVKEICKNLHLSGTWKGAASMHTEWSDLSEEHINDPKHNIVKTCIGFALDCLVGQGEVVRHNEKTHFCMRCGANNTMKAWLCPDCSKPLMQQVPLAHEGPNCSYIVTAPMLSMGELSDSGWRYPIIGTVPLFAVKGVSIKEKSQVGKGPSIENALWYNMDFMVCSKHESATPEAYR